MENSNIDARFRAYLEGTMSSVERRAFEEELTKNPSLQKALLQATLHKPEKMPENEVRVRAVAAHLRVTTGPHPTPHINLFHHLRLHQRRIAGLAAAFAGILATAFLLWVNVLKPPVPFSDLPSGSFIRPAELGVAGGPGDTSYTAARAIFERSSDFYWKKRSGGLDSLLKIASSAPGFNMAHYYLAHWYLENRQFEKALTEFRTCIDNSTYIQRFRETKDVHKLRFNYLLAELGASGKSDQLMTGFESLLTETPDTSDVHKEAKAVYDELNNPLRLFLFR